jgi:DNA-directed RNA polymerase I subunit RPA2
MFSLVAGLIPYSDHNQSPRNMYQCQMSKQTIGTSTHNYEYQTETKTYRLLNPQWPILRTEAYDRYGIDAYANGINTIVAVLSYTG